MNWKKTRVVLNVWSDGDFRVTENPEAEADERFRLDTFTGAESEFFASLKQAQHAAALRNELELVRADNQRLRIELDECRQADAFERSAGRPAVAASEPDLDEPLDMNEPLNEFDGRGIPTVAAPQFAGHDHSPF